MPDSGLAEEFLEGEFYGVVRENTVALLFAIALQGIATGILRNYRYRHTPRPPLVRGSSARLVGVEEELRLSSLALDNNHASGPLASGSSGHDSDLDEDETEQNEGTAAVMFCSIGLAAALSGLLLLLATNLFREIVSQTLIERFWSYSFMACAISLYGLMPFCYLFLEANGTTFIARMKESLQTACLFWILGAGLVYILTRLLGAEAFMDSHPWLSALNILTSFVCMFFCALVTPQGAASLFRYAASLALPLDHRTKTTCLITQHELDIMVLENQMHTLRESIVKPRRPSAPQRDEDVELETTKLRISTLRQEIVQLRQVEDQNPLARLLLVAIFFLLNSMGWVTVMLRITASLMNHVLSSNLRPWGVGEPQPPPQWWPVTEPIALGFFSVSTIVGFFQRVPQLQLRRHKTPAPRMVASISLVLLITMALPLICRALGISIVAYGPYANVPLIRNHPWLASSYKAFMLWQLGPARTLL
ncbi:hypothetical protein DFJ77DRAFT_545101 [Powellomyces hirtus]|nr:hypothetical protein DFJ77DRAFT_545101 [Powellomyces hirtus]